MPTSRRRIRRGERARRRRFLIGACVVLGLLAVSLLQLSRQSAVVPASPAPPIDTPPLTFATVPAEGADFEPDPPRYSYAVIPTGAANVGELEEAIDRDPVVRAHYANFNLRKTHVVRLTEPRVAHVSYRIGNDVFWTRRALLLKVGETLLTDGEHYARTRCGNQLATVPAATSPDEPTAEILNTPLPRGKTSFPLTNIPPTTPPPSAFGPGGAAGNPLSWVAPRSPFIPGGGSPHAQPPGPVFVKTGAQDSTARSGTPGDGDPSSPAAPPHGTSNAAGPDGTGVTAPRRASSVTPPEKAGPGSRPSGTSTSEGDGSSSSSTPSSTYDGTGPPKAVRPLTDGPKSIPEPAVLALFVAGGSAWLRRRWNRRRIDGHPRG